MLENHFWVGEWNILHGFSGGSFHLKKGVQKKKKKHGMKLVSPRSPYESFDDNIILFRW